MRVNLSDLFVYIFESSKRCHSRVDRYSYSTLDAFFLVHSRVLIGGTRSVSRLTARPYFANIARRGVDDVTQA